jgi:uncharacterized membrane protein (DUF485 family)
VTRALARDLAICLAAFAGGTLLAELFGAENLGTAMTFGQIAFMGAVVAVILWRARSSRA